MATATNKVRFGLSRVHYAIWDEDQQKYGTPKPLAGAVSISFEPQGSQSNFFADNTVYYISNPTSQDTGSLEIADVSDEAAVELFGLKNDAVAGITYEETVHEMPTFALLYQVEGDGNTLRGVRYNVKMNRLSETHSTTTDSVEPQTYTVDYTATGRDFTVSGDTVNVIKASTTNGGQDHAAYDAWFDEVVCPGKAPTGA